MSTNLPATSVAVSDPLQRRPAGLDAPAPPFVRLVRLELRKSVDTVTGRWLLVATGVLVLGALALAATLPASGRDADLQYLLSTALLPVSLLLPVLGVLLMSGEFSTRSVLTTFALVPSRARVVAAKTAAAVLLAVAGTVITGALTAGAAGALDLAGGLDGWAVAPAVLLQLLVLQVVYVAVGVGFGLLCQNTPLAVVTYLVVPVLASSVVLFVPSLREIGSWLDLTTGTTPLMMGDVADAGDWGRVASVTAIWAVVPFVLGWLRLRRREIA